MVEKLDNKFVAFLALIYGISSFYLSISDYIHVRHLDRKIETSGYVVKSFRITSGHSGQSGGSVMLEIPETYYGDVKVSYKSFMKIKSSVDSQGYSLTHKSVRVRNLIDNGNHVLVEDDKFSDFFDSWGYMFWSTVLALWGVFRLLSKQ